MIIKKHDSTLKITLKILLLIFSLWFFFIYLKWGTSTTIYSKCFNPMVVNTDRLFYNTHKHWKVPVYSYFSPSMSGFQKQMLDEGYLGYISKDPALISDKKFEHPKDVTFDGKIVILKSSTLEELLNPGVLVFASVSVDNEKYVIPDNDLSSEIMKIIQKSGCYVENHSFRLSRGETY